MKRKIWLVPASLSTLVAPVVLAASCGGNGQKSEKNDPKAPDQALLKNVKSAADLFNIDNYNKKPDNVKIDFPDASAKLGVVNLTQTATYSENSFENDATNDYGSYQGHVYESAVGYLLRKQNLFQPIIETKRNGLSQIEYVIKRPSIWKYKLGYVSKVIVTKKDGSVEEFDNDYVNTFPDYDDKVNKTFNSLRYQATAKDDPSNALAQKSINGEHFFNALKGATSIRFAIKKGLKWVDAKGNETKYEIVPEDFYLSYVRTYLLNQGYRESLLTKALPTIVKNNADFNAFDAEANSFLSDGSREFTNQSSYPNSYLWDLYGFDGDSFLDESKFLTDYNGEKVLTFNQNGKSDPNAELLFNNIATVKDFVAFPSQYVAANAKTPQFKNLGKKTQAELDKFLDKVKQIPADNLISRTGTYWYGTDPLNMLYAGSYYYLGYNNSTQKVSWKINKHFWDQDFVNGTSVKQIDQRYQNSTDAKQFNNQNYEDYKLGKIYAFSYSNLTDAQKNEVNQKPQNFGVSYGKTRNWNKLVAASQYRILPGNVEQKPGVDVNFNEPFVKFFYGDNASIATLGDFKGKSNYENLLSGYGLAFRTILSAAYNWQSSASFVSNNKQQAWIAKVAPDGLIGGKDAKSGSDNLVSTYSKKLNSLWALDKDLHKVDLGGGKFEITPEDNIKAATAEASDAGKLKAAHYLELQKAMTALIDDFYTKHPSYDPKHKDADKLMFGYVWRWEGWNAGSGYETLWKDDFIKKTLEGLDTGGRLKVEMKKYDNSTTPSWTSSLTSSGGNSIALFLGWGYDYDGIGSGYDGIMGRQLTSQLLLIGQSTDLQNKLNPIFPNVVKASKAYVKYINDNVASGKFTLSVPLNRLFDAPSSLLSTAYDNFENWIIDSSNKIVLDKANHGTQLSLINSLFWLYYSSSVLTNQENIDLAHELAVYSGPIVDSGRVYAENFAPIVKNPHFRSPFSGTDQAWFEDIRIW